MIALERVTAVVVNWRTPDLTLRAVHALVDDGLPADRVVVVDNASADGSAARLRGELAGSTVVELPENVGFARGNNDGVRRLPGEAYLLVNSDAFVDRPGSLRALTGALEDPTVGIVAARLLNEDGTVQSNVTPLPSPSVALVQASGLSRFVPDRWQPRWSTYWQHGEARSVEAATGAVLLVRASTWEHLRGFDETAFMYAEDRDLCWRAQLAGWDVRFVPEARFVHLGSGSVRTRWDDAARAERVASAEAAMVRRHRGRVSAGATLGIMLAGYRARAAAMRLAGRPERAAVFAASARGLRRAPAPPATLQPPAGRTDETG